MGDTKNDTKEYAVVDGKVEVTRTKQEVQKDTRDYQSVIEQRQRVQDQKDRDNLLRDAELEELDAIIQFAKENSLDVAADVVAVDAIDIKR